MNTKVLGDSGEAYALQWLLWHDYVIEEQNWRHGRQELDIIARKNQTLVFVEVKTRTSDSFSNPETAVDQAKQKGMIKAASAYIDQKKHEGPIRFDVISIVMEPHAKKLLHMPDAFFPLSSE